MSDGTRDVQIGNDGNPSMLYVDTSAGNVGIGTTSPYKKLEVVGDLQLDASNANMWIKSGATGTNGFINWTFNSDDTVYNKIGIDYDTRASTGFHIDTGYPLTLDCTTYIDFKQSGGTLGRWNSTGLGIGTTSPAVKFEISESGAANLRLTSGVSDGDDVAAVISFSNAAGSGGVQGRIENVATEDNNTVFKFYNDSGTSAKMTLNPNGNMTIAGTLTQNSDASLKENVKEIDNALSKVKQLQGVEFNKIGNNKKEIGVIAQDVEKVLPELVLEEDGVKSVAYGNITAVLIEAIKEQQEQIEQLKKQIQLLNK